VRLSAGFPAALGLAILLVGCPEVPRPTANSSAAPTVTTSKPAEHAVGERVQVVERAMGTRVTLAAYTTAQLDRKGVTAALKRAHAEIKRVELLMTTWRATSEVSRINAAAGSKAVSVSQETFDVIAKSIWISKLSSGVFDITFASMGKLWRFDQNLSPTLPDPQAVQVARRRIDYRRIELDRAARSIKLASAETRINLGGIAKGYAIDRAAALLNKAGLPAFFAQAGGDLFVQGRKPNGDRWRVGVRDPRGPDGSFFALLPVENHAFSTAGDYERAFVLEGKRYHHIIDPRTGYPATASRSVTIWAKDALTADAIDDAVFILGPEKGLELVESIDDCGAVIVDASNKVWVSKRLERLVQITRQPSSGP